jgi:hypothetical protein
MNGKLPSLFACFLPYRDSHRENVGKKIGQKIFPKDSKRMWPMRIFGILAVRELPFHLRYCSFGSLKTQNFLKIFGQYTWSKFQIVHEFPSLKVLFLICRCCQKPFQCLEENKNYSFKWRSDTYDNDILFNNTLHYDPQRNNKKWYLTQEHSESIVVILSVVCAECAN